MKIPAIPGFDQTAFEKYFKNTGWLMLGKVGSLVIKMLVGFAVANYLGKGQNGILSYANAFVIVFLAVASLGLDSFIIRELVREPHKKDEILGTAFFLKLFGGLLIIPLIQITYLIFPDERTPGFFVFILSFTGIFQAFNIIDSYFQSQVKAKYIMQVNIAANLVSAGIKVLLVILEMPLEFFVFTFLADSLLLAIGYLVSYNASDRTVFLWRFKKQKALFLLKHSWPLMFSGILVTIYMTIDRVMIGRILGTEALGIYSTVVPLSEAWYFIPMSIVGSLFPAIINAKANDESRYQKRLQDLYDLMVGISLTIAVFMTFASGLVYDLVYKPEFSPGAPVLAVHVWAGVFVFLGVASSQYLINEGLTNISLYRTAIGAAVNVLLNLVLLPSFGIMGAAIATLAAYFISTFSIVLFSSTRKQGLMMLKSLFLISIVKKISNR